MVTEATSLLKQLSLFDRGVESVVCRAESVSGLCRSEEEELRERGVAPDLPIDRKGSGKVPHRIAVPVACVLDGVLDEFHAHAAAGNVQHMDSGFY